MQRPLLDSIVYDVVTLNKYSVATCLLIVAVVAWIATGIFWTALIILGLSIVAIFIPICQKVLRFAVKVALFIAYTLCLFCLADFWLLFGLALLFVSLAIFWVDTKRQGFGIVPISRKLKLTAAMIGIVLLFGGIILDLIGTYQISAAATMAKESQAPLCPDELKALTQYDSIKPTENGGPLLVGVGKILNERYNDWSKLPDVKPYENKIIANGQTIPLTEPFKAELQKFVEQQTELLDMATKALSMPHCRHILPFPSSGLELMSMQMEHLSALRALSRVLLLKTILLCENRQIDAAMQQIKDMAKLARTMQNEPLLISHLIEILLQKYAIQAMVYVASISSDSYAMLQQEIEPWCDHTTFALDKVCFSEISFAYSIAMSHKKEYIRYSRDLWFPLAYLLVIPHGFLKIDLAHVMHKELEIGQVAQREETIRDYLKIPHAQDLCYPLAAHIQPSWDRILEKQLEHLTYARAFWTSLAVAQEVKKIGQLPASLDFISPQQQANTHDPFTGQTLRYTKLEQGKFLVYGVAKDWQDNAGKFMEYKDPKDQDTRPEPYDIGILLQPK